MGKAGLIIRNKEEKLAVECVTKAHKWLNEKFGLDTKLTFSREVNWGKDAWYAGFYLFEDKEVRINIRNLYGNSIKTIIDVLGHEIRHAVQYDTKILSDFGKKGKVHSGRYESGTWKGRRYWGTYWDAPWEIDARKYQSEYADMVIKELGLEKECKVMLPYGTVTVKLKDETQTLFLEKNKKKDIHLFQAYDSKKKSNPNGFCWLDLKQTKYKEWNRETLRAVWNDYYDLLQSQFVPYETKEEAFGGMELSKMIY
jgi:hypothetical protein